MKITIIFDKPGSGEISPDHADVLYQVKSVRDTLTALGHVCTELGFTLNIDRFNAEIKELAPDLVFNLVESVNGRGSLIYLAPSILDALSIPYTGSVTDGIYRTSNKLFAKEWLRANNISTPDYFTLDTLKKEKISITGDYIIKSVWEHASIGLDDQSIISPQSASELFKEMERRKNLLGGQCFAERYIDGREFNISILADMDGPQVLPPAEIRFNSYTGDKRKIVGYEAKWDQDSFEYHNTVRSFDFPDDDHPLLQDLKKISIRCWEAFNIRGYCRVDFRVDAMNQPWVLEINANPCISPDAGFMAAANQAGLIAEDVIKRIINDSNIF
ncbi:MAG: ATP-grasp domain-containing protein [Deltaproteobacteria bacterium]|nr:ATP-grasp domain-containing protein [Deltaproteobacteria bacterium]